MNDQRVVESIVDLFADSLRRAMLLVADRHIEHLKNANHGYAPDMCVFCKEIGEVMKEHEL